MRQRFRLPLILKMLEVRLRLFIYHQAVAIYMAIKLAIKKLERMPLWPI